MGEALLSCQKCPKAFGVIALDLSASPALFTKYVHVLCHFMADSVRANRQS